MTGEIFHSPKRKRGEPQTDSAPRILFAPLALFAAIIISGCTETADPARVRELIAAADKLRPLHTKLGKTQPGDWLESHPEAGQTFRQYLTARPVTPQGTRKIIYVTPIGDFTETQRKVVDETAEYLSICYSREVKKLDAIPLAKIPAKARRTHPTWGMEQILTDHVLFDVLRPKLPKDAAASIALTATDLWPGEGWNFVFGQASLRDRVGVWSLYRNGEPEKNDEEYKTCLLRTIKTAAHEMGHIFSMAHCTAYECNMCGSNNREESDRRPLSECPECMAKICWATEADPAKRYEKLAEFCRAKGLRAEQDFFGKSAKKLAEKPTP